MARMRPWRVGRAPSLVSRERVPSLRIPSPCPVTVTVAVTVTVPTTCRQGVRVVALIRACYLQTATRMFGFFKFIMYLGVAMGLLGFALPYFYDQPFVQGLPPETKTVLSFGGLGLIVLGLVGRTATRPDT
jgi:hypothetical protein